MDLNLKAPPQHVAGVFVPSIIPPRGDLNSVMVCLPAEPTEVEAISAMLAPRGPVNPDLVRLYHLCYQILPKERLISLLNLIFLYRQSSSLIVLLVVKGQLTWWGYTKSFENLAPSSEDFAQALKAFAFPLAQWELGIIAHTQGLSMSQARHMYRVYSTSVTPAAPPPAQPSARPVTRSTAKATVGAH